MKETLCHRRMGIALVIAFLLILYAIAPTLAETEPAIPHPQQQEEAAKKLKALEQKLGKRPNILIMIVDDMGWGDPGVYGGGLMAGAPTPNIDRMAHGGLMLTSAYAQPTCSPTRATMMTGRLPIRHGIYRPPMYSEKGGLVGEVTAAQILRESGYHTALVGKWHLGESESQQPQNVGYDEYFGFLGVCDIYTEWRDPYFNPEVVYSPERTAMIKMAPFSKHLVKAKRGEKLEELKEITIPVLANIDQDFTDYTVDFLKRMADGDKPFYLIHAFSKVHFDNYPADGYHGKSPAKYPYKDGIVEVDDIVGRIIKTLNDTGLAENTLVFFTSDNGPEEDMYPDCGFTPFRGGKGSTWEGGMRVPGIVYWPGTVKPGRVSDGLFDLADLFNTSLSLADAEDKIPADRYIDGVDQTSFLLADKGASNRRSVFYYLNEKLAAVRWAEYKAHAYIVEVGNGEYEAMGSMQNATIQQAAKSIFYNLYMDPKERTAVTIRKLYLAPILQGEMARHKMSLMKYPPKKPQVTIE